MATKLKLKSKSKKVIKAIDPDDILTPEESARIKKAEREMQEGKYITLDQLLQELGYSRPRRGRKATG